MGARGPKPGTGGRPRKPLSEKILDGNPGKRNIRVLKNYTDLEGADMPNPKDYLLDAQKDGKAFQAEEIYQSVWKWLNDRHCAQHVSAELIEHYALSAARLIQCERAISTYRIMLLVPEADRLIRCPQWQQCVISISVAFAILHRLLQFLLRPLLPQFISEENSDKGNHENPSNIPVPFVIPEGHLDAQILAADENHEIEIVKAQHHL